MRKSYLFGLAAMLVIGLIIAFRSSRPDASKPITFEEAKKQAAHQSQLPRCLAASGHARTIPDTARRNLDMVVGSKLIDVPAGTEYGVFYSDYSNSAATGTIEYAGSYGTYNFQTRKSGSNTAADWKLSDFEACEPSV